MSLRPVVRIVIPVTIVRVPAEPEFTFLVERYLPVGDVDGLAQAVDRVASVCAGGSAVGDAVRYVQSTFVPGDDTCFCVFQAPSLEAVRAVNEAGHFPLDRISVAISLPLARLDRSSAIASRLDHESSSHNKESR
jgi:hypothetical protein